MWSHKALTTLTNDQIIAEVVYTAAAIRQIIGVTPSIVRPPVMEYLMSIIYLVVW